MKKNTLRNVFIAILLAFIAGFFTGTERTFFGVPWVRIFGLIGQLFLNALVLVVVPLVVSSIITGSSRMGREKQFGKLGIRTFGFFLLTTLIAVLIGAACTLLLQPGGSMQIAETNVQGAKIVELTGAAHGSAFDKLEIILFKVIPSNIFAVASHNQMLGLITFSILLGFYASRIEQEAGQTVLAFFRGIFQIMMRMIELGMLALPLGVFGLVAKTVASTGFDAIKSLLYFFITALIAFAVYLFVIWPLILRFWAKVSPAAHFRGMAPALFTGFSTSSSAATLPVTIECVEKNIGVSNRISSFTLPLGSTLNLSGTALYSALVVFFIAQVYGADLSFANQMLIILMACLTSFGMAGIPSAGLVSIVMILHTVELPAEGIGLILATERILDMVRTAINGFGNGSCAVLVAKSFGERTVIDLGET